MCFPREKLAEFPADHYFSDIAFGTINRVALGDQLSITENGNLIAEKEHVIKHM